MNTTRPFPPPASDGPRPGDIVRHPNFFHRETVEAIVIAFTLALLFRAFEAEAYVIPTGSMAPTLMGRHKDLTCGACGNDYRVGCSAEEDDQSLEFRAQLARLEAEADGLRAAAGRGDGAEARAAARRLESLEARGGPLDQLRTRLARKLVPASRCGNCGHVMQLVEDTPQGVGYDPRYPSYPGDRVLVDKMSYDFREPRRFDVVVFKYPEDAKTNYIKRLIGLPGETVSIVGGDIWTSRDGAAAEIARKPPERLRAMLQCVHDTGHEAEALAAAGWPARWTDWMAPGSPAAWTREGGAFSTAAPAATLRYRHLVAGPDEWRAAREGRGANGAPRGQLIDDFQPYNAVATRPHWVGDLAVEVRLTSRAAGGSVSLDLVEAGKQYRCTIDLGTGNAELSLPGVATPARGTTPVRGRGAWKILFANVDDEVSLFVGDRRVAFDAPTRWNGSIDAAEASGPTNPRARRGTSAPATWRRWGSPPPVPTSASNASACCATCSTSVPSRTCRTPAASRRGSGSTFRSRPTSSSFSATTPPPARTAGCGSRGTTSTATCSSAGRWRCSGRTRCRRHGPCRCGSAVSSCACLPGPTSGGCAGCGSRNAAATRRPTRSRHHGSSPAVAPSDVCVDRSAGKASAREPHCHRVARQ